jgi:hypothetical protein
MPGTDYPRRAQLVESSHRPEPWFELSVVGFGGVVGVLRHDVAYGGQQLIEHSWVGWCPVGAHLGGASAVLEGASEEPASGRQIPLLGHQYVDDLAVLVDCPIQIHPLPDDRDIRLIDEPPIPTA